MMMSVSCSMGLSSLQYSKMCMLQEHLEDGLEYFESLDSFEKASVMLGRRNLVLRLILCLRAH